MAKRKDIHRIQAAREAGRSRVTPEPWEIPKGERAPMLRLKPKQRQGIGIGGVPRRGKPKTEAQRRATHKRLTGRDELPPRGTGLKRRR